MKMPLYLAEEYFQLLLGTWVVEVVDKHAVGCEFRRLVKGALQMRHQESSKFHQFGKKTDENLDLTSSVFFFASCNHFLVTHISLVEIQKKGRNAVSPQHFEGPRCPETKNAVDHSVAHCRLHHLQRLIREPVLLQHDTSHHRDNVANRLSMLPIDGSEKLRRRLYIVPSHILRRASVLVREDVETR